VVPRGIDGNAGEVRGGGSRESTKEDEENVAYGSLQQRPETCNRFRDAFVSLFLSLSFSRKILIAR